MPRTDLAHPLSGLRSELVAVRGEIAQLEDRLQPLRERESKLNDAIHAIEALLPQTATAPDELPLKPHASEGDSSVPRRRRTPRHAMLDALIHAGKPLHPRDLWEAMRAEGIESSMASPSQAVYQTMYAARKEGLPVERLEDGTWVWRGE